MQYDEHSEGSEIKLALNNEFEVVLPEIRTAGYHWVIAEKGEPMLKLLLETMTPSPAGVGGSGKRLWRFRAVSAGETELKFEYRRPWQESEEPARAFSLKVHVGS